MDSAKSFFKKVILLVQKIDRFDGPDQEAVVEVAKAPQLGFGEDNCGILLGISHWFSSPIRPASLPSPYNLLLSRACNLICVYLCVHKHIHPLQLSRNSSGAPTMWCLLWSHCGLHINYNPISCLVQIYYLLHPWLVIIFCNYFYT